MCEFLTVFKTYDHIYEETIYFFFTNADTFFSFLAQLPVLEFLITCYTEVVSVGSCDRPLLRLLLRPLELRGPDTAVGTPLRPVTELLEHIFISVAFSIPGFPLSSLCAQMPLMKFQKHTDNFLMVRHHHGPFL